MAKKKYVIDDRGPSILPKIGSAVIALGSFASVAALASPETIPLLETQSLADGPTAQPSNDSLAGASTTSEQADSGVTSQIQTSPAPTLPTTQLSSPTGNNAAPVSSTSTVNLPRTESSAAPNLPVSDTQSTSVSLPSLPSAGNTSSPTPVSGSSSGSSWSGSSGGTSAAGNTSSPTPSSGGSSASGSSSSSSGSSSGNVSSPTPGGGYEDEDHDEDEDDDHDEDEDDDHDEDEDDD